MCAVGGKVSANESFHNAAMREMKEEIGVCSNLEYIKRFIYDKEDYKAIFSVFTTKENIEIEELRPDPKEIEYIKAVSKDKLFSMFKTEQEMFCPTFLVAIEELLKQKE